jgi:HPt (histidine-containing phosphotransfer) domain-containing protein
LTAGSSEKEKKAIEAAGMDDLLLKPFSQAGLMKILGKYVQVKGDEQVDHSGTAPDLTDLMELANGDASFVVNMLQIFLKNSKQDLSGLHEAFTGRDFQKIKGLAHKMIPPCRHLGFEAVVEELKLLENVAEEKNESSVQESVKRISSLLESLYPEIEKELRKLTPSQASSNI